MTTELQQNRYDQIIRRVGGLIGPGSKVSEVIAELFPMIDVERVPGELLLLGGTRLCIAGGRRAGTAAVMNQIQLRNPADSGMLMVVTNITMGSATQQILMWGLTTGQLAADANLAFFRDGRLGDVDRPVGQLRVETDAGGNPQIFPVDVLADQAAQFSDENGVIVLSPGTNAQVTNTVVNTTLNVGFMWRERPAEQSELNL